MEWRTQRPVNTTDPSAIDRIRDGKVVYKPRLEETSEEQIMLTGIVSRTGLILLLPVGAANQCLARVFVATLCRVNSRTFIRGGM